MPQNLSPDAGWTEFRNQMPVTENWAYMDDDAAVAPLPSPTRVPFCSGARRQAGKGMWLAAVGRPGRGGSAGSAAQLINADPGRNRLRP